MDKPIRVSRVLRGVILLAPLLVLGFGSPVRAQSADTKPAKDESATTDGLVRRLRDSGGGDDIDARIQQLMEQAQERLERNFDTGTETQRIQHEILGRIDEAIEIAKRNLRPNPSSSSSSRPQRGEKRQSGQRHDKQSAKASGGKPGGEPDTGSTPQGGGDTASAAGDDPLADTRRGWGNLPDRDREAVIQGFKEDFLRKYGELIEAYYRALSDTSDE
jgi:hypothetical protein